MVGAHSTDPQSWFGNARRREQPGSASQYPGTRDVGVAS
jgi:hypothetical protein